MTQQLTVSLLMLAVFSCGRSTIPDEPAPAESYGETEQYAKSKSPDAGTSTPTQCLTANKACGAQSGVSASCCGSLRCIEFSVYDWPRCSLGRADGSFCYASDQCQSLNCQNSKCVAPACKAAGAICQTDSNCCGGTFCNSSLAYGYGPSRCSAPQVNGASCTNNAQCRSGICHDYECVASVCSAAAATCGSDADCCRGLFCDGSFSYGYGPQRCRAPMVNGSSCSANNQCQSGLCRDYQCVPLVCSKAGVSCTQSADCCLGTWCDNQTYGPWQCRAAQTPNSYCLSSEECISQICVNNLCR
jgi:hypothetical protein